MILRVPDYYQEFSCIADKCQDSCCIGWEIDIDEDTYEFYQQADGEIGERLRKYMYMTTDGDHSFELQEHGRCPFLNKTNLCDLCIAFGEEALSEVCTEYPRFAIEYGNVLQKCLSLSCEEVGRILFTREEAVQIVDIPYGEFSHVDQGYDCDEEENYIVAAGEVEDASEDNFVDHIQEDDEVIIDFLEEVQKNAIHILQNKEKHINERMKEYLYYAEYVQTRLNNYERHGESADCERELQAYMSSVTEVETSETIISLDLTSYDFYQRRFQVFEKMETLDEEWESVKRELKIAITKENYDKLYFDYIKSGGCKELDYEQLMVYFTFRYFMNAVYDYDLLSYAKFAVVCTLVLRDIDMVRFHRKHGSYSREDRIDVVRVFSKEVEHSEENVELAREEFMFDEIFTIESLVQQITI